MTGFAREARATIVMCGIELYSLVIIIIVSVLPYIEISVKVCLSSSFTSSISLEVGP